MTTSKRVAHAVNFFHDAGLHVKIEPLYNHVQTRNSDPNFFAANFSEGPAHCKSEDEVRGVTASSSEWNPGGFSCMGVGRTPDKALMDLYNGVSEMPSLWVKGCLSVQTHPEPGVTTYNFYKVTPDASKLTKFGHLTDTESARGSFVPEMS